MGWAATRSDIYRTITISILVYPRTLQSNPASNILYNTITIIHPNWMIGRGGSIKILLNSRFWIAYNNLFWSFGYYTILRSWIGMKDLVNNWLMVIYCECCRTSYTLTDPVSNHASKVCYNGHGVFCELLPGPVDKIKMTQGRDWWPR